MTNPERVHADPAAVAWELAKRIYDGGPQRSRLSERADLFAPLTEQVAFELALRDAIIYLEHTGSAVMRETATQLRAFAPRVVLAASAAPASPVAYHATLPAAEVTP